MGERDVTDTLPVPRQLELTPALRNLIETFVPSDAHCLSVGCGARPLNALLSQHGCSTATVGESHLPALPFEPASFDAALLIGVLDHLAEPYRAARELRRVLRPGGVLLATAANDRYWRRRIVRVLPREVGSSASYSPGSLRRLLLDAGFDLVGVEGQDGAIVRDLPLAGRFSRGRSSTPYRVAERLLPALLGSQVGAFAVRL
jgi:SAM-dependent methyltransferase